MLKVKTTQVMDMGFVNASTDAAKDPIHVFKMWKIIIEQMDSGTLLTHDVRDYLRNAFLKTINAPENKQTSVLLHELGLRRIGRLKLNE